VLRPVGCRRSFADEPDTWTVSELAGITCWCVPGRHLRAERRARRAERRRGVPLLERGTWAFNGRRAASCGAAGRHHRHPVGRGDRRAGRRRDRPPGGRRRAGRRPPRTGRRDRWATVRRRRADRRRQAAESAEPSEARSPPRRRPSEPDEDATPVSDTEATTRRGSTRTPRPARPPTLGVRGHRPDPDQRRRRRALHAALLPQRHAACSSAAPGGGRAASRRALARYLPRPAPRSRPDRGVHLAGGGGPGGGRRPGGEVDRRTPTSSPG